MPLEPWDSRDQLVLFWASQEELRTLENAAALGGKDLPAFLHRVSLRKAKALLKRRENPPPRSSRVIPEFFRVLCLEAKTQDSIIYERAGYELARHTPRLQSFDYQGMKEFQQRLRVLEAALVTEDIDAVWDWYSAEHPKCIRLIPSGHKETFLAGVMKAFWDGALDL